MTVSPKTGVAGDTITITCTNDTELPPPVPGNVSVTVDGQPATFVSQDGQSFIFTYELTGEENGGEVGYPANPNGAAGDVAGICDPTGRVLGLMPHPERNLDPWAHPTWTRLPASRSEGEGLAFYRALVESAMGASL